MRSAELIRLIAVRSLPDDYGKSVDPLATCAPNAADVVAIGRDKSVSESCASAFSTFASSGGSLTHSHHPCSQRKPTGYPKTSGSGCHRSRIHIGRKSPRCTHPCGYLHAPRQYYHSNYFWQLSYCPTREGQETSLPKSNTPTFTSPPTLPNTCLESSS